MSACVCVWATERRGVVVWQIQTAHHKSGQLELGNFSAINCRAGWRECASVMANRFYLELINCGLIERRQDGEGWKKEPRDHFAVGRHHSAAASSGADVCAFCFPMIVYIVQILTGKPPVPLAAKSMPSDTPNVRYVRISKGPAWNTSKRAIRMKIERTYVCFELSNYCVFIH